MHADQYLHYSSHHQTNFTEKVVPPCFIEHIPLPLLKMAQPKKMLE